MTPSFLPPNPALASNSGRSRIESHKLPLHPLEAALVGVTTLHLCFLPWALGAMHVWSQLTSLGLSLIGFGLACLPRIRVRESGSKLLGAQRPVIQLLRFPLFWAGLALLGYIAVQGFNPAWLFKSDADSWWLEPIAHVAWLPSGVDAPFDRSSPWRVFTIGASLWLLVCSVWAGFLRRKSYQVLFSALAGNAFLLALLGVVQKLSGTDRIFWSYLPSNYKFVASFIYPNHAGSYFNLMVALTVGLALWQYQRARHGFGGKNLARILTGCAVFIGTAVILSSSRMSIALLLMFAALVGGLLALRQFRGKGSAREFLPLALFLAGSLGVGLVSSRSEKIWERFAETIANPATIDHHRTIVRRAATDMLRDRWLLGWGAGCFRYGFPLFAQHYPEIYTNAQGDRRYWEHAHDDLLEFPIELGAVGSVPLAIMLGCGAWELGRRRFWRSVLSFCLVLGGTLVLLHAWVDFVFQNPAVLFTWSACFVGAARWAELDDPARRRPVVAN